MLRTSERPELGTPRPAINGPTPEDRRRLDAARRAQERIVEKADRALERAMQHADQVIAPTYRGPERRRVPR